MRDRRTVEGMTEDPREVWERVNAAQRDRWREHVRNALPERLLDGVTEGPVEELPG